MQSVLYHRNGMSWSVFRRFPMMLDFSTTHLAGPGSKTADRCPSQNFGKKLGKSSITH